MPDDQGVQLFVSNVQRQFLPAVKWEPDRIGDGISNILDAKNVLPHADGYETIGYSGKIDQAGSAPTSAVYTGILTPGVPRYHFISTSEKIHRYAPNADYKEMTGSVSAGPWTFCLATNLVIATAGSGGGPPQVAERDLASVFTDLGGSPPNGFYFCDTVRDFVVFARQNGGYNRVQWSALGAPEDWTPSAVTQADFQDILDEGPIEGFVGGEYGIIFFKHAIYRMSYIGPPAIFQFDKISTTGLLSDIETGGVVYNQAARLHDNVYFVCQQGLGRIVAGQSVQFPMARRCARYIQYDWKGGTNLAQVCADPMRNIVVLGYGSFSGGSATAMDKMIFYDEVLDRFSRAEFAAEAMFVGGAVEFEGAGGQPYPQVTQTFTFYDTAHRHRMLLANGNPGATALTPIVDTEERQMFPGRRAIVREATPHVEPMTSVTVAIGSRVVIGGSISRTSGLPVNSNGWAGFRKEGRYHSARITTSAGEPDGGRIIRGVEVEAVMQGKR